VWWVIEEVMIPTACSRNSNRDKDGKEIKKVGMCTLIFLDLQFFYDGNAFVPIIPCIVNIPPPLWST